MATDFHATVRHGDSMRLTRVMSRNAADVILTDPSGVVSYRRWGWTVRKDDNAHSFRPAFWQIHHVLKWGGFSLCVSGCCILPDA